MNDSLHRIRQWISTYAPDVIELNDGATPEEIQAAETAIGVRFPDELKVYLRQCNGETWSSEGLIGNWRLMELDDIVDEWQVMEKLCVDGSFGDNDNQATPYIKGFWWNPKWIPCVTSESGHFMCVDSDPAEEGRSGQLILFLHDQPERYLIAHSLKDWFEAIASGLESGRCRRKQGRFEHEAFMHISLEGSDMYG